MANYDIILTNFTSGELSPRMYGRVDFSRYYNGVEVLENFLISPQGGAMRRPGLRHVNEVKDSSKVTRLIPFQFSTAQAYILEFGDQYVRFYMDEGQIESGGSPYEIVSPFTELELFTLSYTQSADVLYIAHGNYITKKLSRTGHTSWAFSNIEPQDGPYFSLNTTATTVTPSATTGSITLTSSTDLFASTDVGRLVRLLHGNKWGCAKITAYTSATSVSADVLENYPLNGTAATDLWRLGSWSDTTGWPEIIEFHSERLFFANHTTMPQRVWGSESDGFETYSPTNDEGTVTDASGINYLISSGQVNAVNWLMSVKDNLVVGTTDGEHIIKQAAVSEPLSPENIKSNRERSYGSARIKPVFAHGNVLFVQKTQRKLYEYGYDYTTDSFAGSNLNLFADHITRGKIKELAYTKEPYGIVWACLEDGSLVSLTYLPNQKVYAWYRHTIGGEDVKVKSIAAITSPDNTHDQLWLIIERTINGQTKQYIEFMEEEFYTEDDDISDAFFVDSGLTSDNVNPVSLVSGLDHLIGETVSILVDGKPHPDKVVDASGIINLDYSGSKIHVGLNYISRIKTLPIEVNNGQGTVIPKQKRIFKLNLYFYKSIGGKYGLGDNLMPFKDRNTHDNYDTTAGLRTGIYEVPFNKGWTKLPQLELIQDQPLPFNITSIITGVTIAE